MPEQSSSGVGHLRSGRRDLGVTRYEIHVGLMNKPETVVELESPPVVQNGEILELILENGQVLQVQVAGDSPYCRVIGGRLARERRADNDRAVSSDMDRGRRRSDTRNAAVIQHPCPRCMAGEVLVTHRGVMMTASVLRGLPSRLGRTARRRCAQRPARIGGQSPVRNRAERRTPIGCRRRPAPIARPTHTCAPFAARPKRCISRVMDAKRCGPARDNIRHCVAESVIPRRGRAPTAVFRRGIGWRPSIFPAPSTPQSPSSAARSTPSSRIANAPTFDNTIAATGARGPHARSGRAHVRRRAGERHESRVSGARARVAAQACRGRRRHPVQPGIVSADRDCV